MGPLEWVHLSKECGTARAASWRSEASEAMSVVREAMAETKPSDESINRA